MQILGHLGMYFDEVEKNLLLYGLTLAILCLGCGLGIGDQNLHN